MTREDRQRILQLADNYNSSDKTYEENVLFAEEVVALFPFSSFQILRGRRFKKFWDDVVERTAFLDKIYSEKDISRLYYYINRLQQPIVCSADNCSEIYTKKISPKMLNRSRFYCNNACAQQDSAVKQQIKKTKEANHTTTRDLLEQTRKRNLEKFGCDWFFLSKEFEEKKLEAWQKSGYDHPMHSDEVKQKMSDRYFAEHGVRHAFEDPAVVEKIHLTNIENFGAPTPALCLELRAVMHAKSTESKVRAYYRDTILNFEDVEPMFSEDFYAEHRDGDFLLRWRCKLCGSEFSSAFRHEEPRCEKCKPKIYSSSTSELEREVFEFVCSVKSPYKCCFCQAENWSVLAWQKQQLDIVCIDPATSKVAIAFEVNGVYWHSTSMKPHNYHLNKTKACEKMGIKLVHIWEDEWLEKKDEMKKLIEDALQGNMLHLVHADGDKLEVPRDKISKCWKINGYHLAEESECRVVLRGNGDKTYEVEDCGVLTYEKDVAYDALKVIELKELIEKNPFNYGRCIRSKGFMGRVPDRTKLLNYVLEATQRMCDTDFLYSLKTRVFWIVNGISSWEDERVCCKICGKPIKSWNIVKKESGYKMTCSKKCDREMFKKTNPLHMKQKYGVENAFLIPDVLQSFKERKEERIAHRCATKMKHYGDPNFNNSKKASKTKLERYGSIWNLDACKETWKEKYLCMPDNNVEVLVKEDIETYQKF